MPTRQYIGARYVPKFADPIAWDNAVAYEPLTIVTYLGTSYTSKKAVPVGTAITNTEYWVATGNYNAQVEEYVEEVQTLAGRVDDIDTDIAQFNNPYFIFQGDSYAMTEGYTWSTWGQLVAQYLGLSANQYTILDNSGGGFTDVGDNGNFLTHLQNAAVTGHEVTHIVVCGGANDRNENTSTLASDIAAYISGAKTMYPNAKIYVGMIGNSSNPTYAEQMMMVSYKYYKEVSVEHGAIWMESPTWACAFGDDWYNELHPGEVGQKKIARAIANEINGLDYDCVIDKTNIGCTFVSGFTAYESLQISFWQRNEVMEIKLKGNYKGTTRIGIDTPPAAFYTDYTKIAEFTPALIGATYYEAVVPTVIDDTSNNPHVFPMNIKIQADGIYVRCFSGILNPKIFTIPSFSFSVTTRRNYD